MLNLVKFDVQNFIKIHHKLIKISFKLSSFYQRLCQGTWFDLTYWKSSSERLRLKCVICLHMFIEWVIDSMSCIMPGFPHVRILEVVLLQLVSSYFQSMFIGSSRHMLERVVTTWLSRQHFALRHPLVLLTVSTTLYTPRLLLLTTRLLLSHVVSALRRLESMWVFWTWMAY